MELYNWAIVDKFENEVFVSPDAIIGNKIKASVFNNPRFDDGEMIYTAPIKSISNGVISTEFGDYKLGKISAAYMARFGTCKKLYKND